MMIKNKDAIIIEAMLIALTVCALFHSFRICSMIALFAYFGFFGFLVYLHPYFVFKYFSLFFSAILIAVGVTVAEFSNVYLHEINSQSHFVGSLPLLLFYLFAFILFLMGFDGLFSGKSRKAIQPARMTKRHARINHYLAVLSAGLFFLQFARIARRPAFLLGYDRFLYAAQFGGNTGIWRMIDALAYVLVTFSILDLINGHKLTGLMGMLFYVLYYLWNGNKFGPFFTLGCFFLMVYYKRISINKKAIRRTVIAISVLAILIICFAAVLSSGIMGITGVEYITERIAQQGQLWWKTYNIVYKTHLAEISDELNGMLHGSTVISDNIGADYGIYKIMYLCGMDSYIDYKLSTGSRFTEAGFAAAYYYCGIMGGFLFAAICAFFISKTVNKLTVSLERGEYILIVITARFFMLEREAMSLFIFQNFIDFVSFASYAVLLYYLFFGNRFGQRQIAGQGDEQR